MHQQPYLGDTLQSADPSRVVFVCQSKADADVLSSLDCLATYAPSWANGISGGLWNRVVVAIAPDDDAGRDFAYSTHACLAANAKNFRYLLMDRVPEGRTVGEVLRLLDKPSARKVLKGLVTPLLEAPQEPPQTPYSEEEPEDEPAPSREPWVQPMGSHEGVVAWPEPLDLFRETPLPRLRAEYLPDALQAVITEQAMAVGADPAIVTIAALVACASCIHDGIKLQPKRHDKFWTESARLWGAVVGDPSVRKSPAAGRVTSHLWAIDREIHAKSAVQFADWNRQIKDHKKSKSEAEPPPKPKDLRLMVQDTTIEKVSDLLADNERGMVAIHRELAAWFGQMDCYRQGAGGKDQAYWLQFYDGGPMVIDRMSRDTVFVPNGSMCLFGEIQPSKMRKLAKDMPDDGLLQRFMVVTAKRYSGSAPDEPFQGDALADYRALQDALFAIQPSDERVKLSDEALSLRVKFEDDMLELAASDVLPDRMRSAVAKWVGLWCRLALTYHVIECSQLSVHPVNKPVSIETATAVDLFLRRFLMGHTYAFYTDLLGGGVGTDHAKWIAGYLLAGKVEQIDNRTITHAYKAWRTTPDWVRNMTWRSLEDSGWINPVFAAGNRFKITHWLVNPLVHSAFSDIAESENQRRTRVRERLAAGLGIPSKQDNKRQQDGDSE